MGRKGAKRSSLTYDQLISNIKDLKRVIDAHVNDGLLENDDPPYKDAVKLLMHYKRKLNQPPYNKNREEGIDE